ncbi:hypothetical protein GCM10023321_10710 [Pseudonocardia eucalypti]|uniref:PE-PPE domain-containing protein n=1 Tax=Pseudonocardia eucalypti TaxID=648755 RepID=A0ABP9PR59_9PSEU|nr:hypothetical protein [Pseudonocardia eucalypti]
MRKPGYLWTGALLVALLAVSLWVPSTGSARERPDEHHYYILIGGTGDPDSSNFPSVHDGKAVPVEYPACAPACGATSYDQSVAAGHAHARKAIERIYADDRVARFTVAGYSQGAHVANLVLNDVADGVIDIPAERFDAKLYADPMQPGTGVGANVPKGVGVPPPLAMTSPGPGRSDFGGIPFTRYCIETDGVCHFNTLEAAGGYVLQHSCYPRDVMPATLDDGEFEDGTHWWRRVNCGPQPSDG